MSVQEKMRWSLTEYLLMHRVTNGNKRKNSDEKSMSANTRRPEGSLEAIKTEATIEALRDTFPLNVVGFFTESLVSKPDIVIIIFVIEA